MISETIAFRPGWLENKVLEQQDIIDDLERTLALERSAHEATRRDRDRADRTSAMLAQALALKAETIEVPSMADFMQDEA